MKPGWLLVAALLMASAPGGKPRAPATARPAAPTALPTAPPVAGDWNSYVRVSPVGTYIVGNPRAPMKIVEHISFTCSHCAAFSVESGAVFRGQMIKSGAVLIEYRPTVRDQVDLAATMLVRCIGPKRFAAASEAIFARQDDWLPLAASFMRNDASRFALEPPLQQMKVTAQLSGLTDLMREQGMTSAEIDACFTRLPVMKQAVAVGDASRKIIKGTPTFFLNGVMTKEFEWSKLEPILRAKGVQ
jgi:protein-disulfide isomerase